MCFGATAPESQRLQIALPRFPRALFRTIIHWAAGLVNSVPRAELNRYEYTTWLITPPVTRVYPQAIPQILTSNFSMIETNKHLG